jgi:hypothetical protein
MVGPAAGFPHYQVGHRYKTRRDRADNGNVWLKKDKPKERKK